MADVDILGGVRIGGKSQDPAEIGAHVPGVVPTDPIGVNRPLLIRIQQIFTGQKSAGQVLISSSVRSALVHKKAPYAIHGVRRDVDAGEFLPFTAPEDGSTVVYYTKACTDSEL